MYDSLHLGLPTSFKRTVADFMFSDRKSIIIQHMYMQQQTSGSDCGLYALDTATVLCNRQNPGTFHFEDWSMI